MQSLPADRFSQSALTSPASGKQPLTPTIATGSETSSWSGEALFKRSPRRRRRSNTSLEITELVDLDTESSGVFGAGGVIGRTENFSIRSGVCSATRYPAKLLTV